ncbi:MAG: glycosyltransferase family 2 protein [Metamycoplasmataceae bacterium]
MKSFSVIIPAFNSEKFINSCLNSLINLNYPKDKVEVIVVDDGSTDKTGEMVKEIIKTNPFIKYFKKENGNWGSVINYVVKNKLVNNDYISVLDSDDQLLPEAFNILNKISKDNDFLTSPFWFWDGKNNKKKQKIYPFWFLFKNQFNNKFQMKTPVCLPLNVFTKKEVFYSLKSLKEGIAYQDTDYISQLMQKSKNIVTQKKGIGLYYFNREDNSTSQTWDQKRFDAQYFALLKTIENDAQEIVAFVLHQKNFNKILKEKEIKITVNRKFNFGWWPFYLRPFYWIYFSITVKKYFIIKKK